MIHPLEDENEELRNRIEATYDEVRDVERKINGYDMYEWVQKTQNHFTMTNTIITNDEMAKYWSNK